MTKHKCLKCGAKMISWHDNANEEKKRPRCPEGCDGQVLHFSVQLQKPVDELRYAQVS
jgi:DNA-directed RNA polymerase subunit RPC12/RpoP